MLPLFGGLERLVDSVSLEDSPIYNFLTLLLIDRYNGVHQYNSL